MQPLLEHSRQLAVLDTALGQHLGPALAAHCQVGNMDKDTLILVADSPAWASRLRFQVQAIREYFNQQFHPMVIHSVQVKVRPVRPDPPRPPSRKPHMSAASADMLRQFAKASGDSALREVLRRLASRSDPD